MGQVGCPGGPQAACPPAPCSHTHTGSQGLGHPHPPTSLPGKARPSTQGQASVAVTGTEGDFRVSGAQRNKQNCVCSQPQGPNDPPPQWPSCSP